mmetsp:Transcript_24881/g.34294  ORF Transcript_24881/g.34294 Transcript_24881/m.34294 type:complete len:571 (-) Transcript_24881:203-1915(-)|eukprot:CAMPEP_0196597526 /NCGR_PEP_ID=MMETSP1081-20130531/91819_1 /TAXON_ID=36882 /ORGANISM="Pyramimonas amylifera, Strain CCMP720" /LENGTH=570 /DNA_ID=CAMNT_0041922957 /DNA_START=129 /DNA_END=1841 /DNA_ORIENTATION=+
MNHADVRSRQAKRFLFSRVERGESPGDFDENISFTKNLKEHADCGMSVLKRKREGHAGMGASLDSQGCVLGCTSLQYFIQMRPECPLSQVENDTPLLECRLGSFGEYLPDTKVPRVEKPLNTSTSIFPKYPVGGHISTYPSNKNFVEYSMAHFLQMKPEPSFFEVSNESESLPPDQSVDCPALEFSEALSLIESSIENEPCSPVVTHSVARQVKKNDFEYGNDKIEFQPGSVNQIVDVLLGCVIHADPQLWSLVPLNDVPYVETFDKGDIYTSPSESSTYDFSTYEVISDNEADENEVWSSWSSHQCLDTAKTSILNVNDENADLLKSKFSQVSSGHLGQNDDAPKSSSEDTQQAGSQPLKYCTTVEVPKKYDVIIPESAPYPLVHSRGDCGITHNLELVDNHSFNALDLVAQVPTDILPLKVDFYKPHVETQVKENKKLDNETAINSRVSENIVLDHEFVPGNSVQQWSGKRSYKFACQKEIESQTDQTKCNGPNTPEKIIKSKTSYWRHKGEDSFIQDNCNKKPKFVISEQNLRMKKGFNNPYLFDGSLNVMDYYSYQPLANDKSEFM